MRNTIRKMWIMSYIQQHLFFLWYIMGCWLLAQQRVDCLIEVDLGLRWTAHVINKVVKWCCSVLDNKYPPHADENFFLVFTCIYSYISNINAHKLCPIKCRILRASRRFTEFVKYLLETAEGKSVIIFVTTIISLEISSGPRSFFEHLFQAC